MIFEFSESQLQLKDAARKALDRECPISRVRAVLEDGRPFDRELWQFLAGMGFVGAAIPEAHGGAGAGHLDLCAIAGELGRALAPVPALSSVYLAAEMLMQAGSEDQKARLLPRIADGSLLVCVAFSEGVGQPDLHHCRTTQAAGRLSGEKFPVLDGGIADMAIVPAAGPDEDMPSLFIVDLQGEGVSREALTSIDPTRGLARLSFDGAPAEPLGVKGEAGRLLDRAFDRAAILLAFEQVGGAERALEMATDYAGQRVAFGRPIGSFQAIKHKLVDLFVDVTLARSNAYFGAWALSNDAAELGLAASAARVSASEAFIHCATENIHVHGAMGFTWDMDCHLFYRRAHLLSVALGGQAMWQDRLVARAADDRQIAGEG